jgi:Tfp pilus assembly protein PilV
MRPLTRQKKNQAGFSLMEVLVATIVLMTGIVAAAQLVPVAVRLNSGARADSTAVVFAERELDEMVAQPLTNATFTDSHANNCNLGNAGTPDQWVGSPLVTVNNQLLIDFSQGTVANYSFTYVDANNPNRTTYDVRWAVYTWAAGGNVTGRRFVLGARLTGGDAPFLPITLDTMVQR